MAETTIVPKIWGEEEWVINTDKYCSKILYLNPGYVCSLHRHPVKDETFYVMGGTGLITVGVVKYQVKPGDVVRVPTGAWHQFASREGMTLLETSTYHEDTDVERRGESHPLTPESDPELWGLLENYGE